MLFCSIILNILLLAVVVWLFIKMRGTKSTWVPASEPDMAEQTEAEEAIASRTLQGKLLIVGMDRKTGTLLHDVLSPAFEVTTADEGVNLPDTVKEIQPDVIISQYILADGTSGNELCSQLKADIETSHISIIFFSPTADGTDIRYAMEAGASDFFIQPVDMKTLCDRVTEIYEHKDRFQHDFVAGREQKAEEEAEEDFSTSLDRKFLISLNTIINRNMGQVGFSSQQLYQEIGMSRTAAYNKIKAITGLAPSDLIRTMRLNKAKELLALHRFTIYEVALKVGYEDPKYFSTSFKKYFGIPPSKI